MANAIISRSALGSPGFTFGRSGTVVQDTWLQTNGVPSNKAGIPLSLGNATAVQLFAVNDRSSTFSISFYYHEGNLTNSVLIDTIDVTSSVDSYKSIEVEIPEGKQLAAVLSSGIGYNVIAGIILKGTVV